MTLDWTDHATFGTSATKRATKRAILTNASELAAGNPKNAGHSDLRGLKWAGKREKNNKRAE